MLDRVREALFSTLGGWLDGARVLDLYSGSGSIGLEALSRGARFVRLVEKSKAARRALNRNVDSLDVHDRVEVSGGDALDPANWEAPDGAAFNGWADIVLMDPPYPHAENEPERTQLLEAMEELVSRVIAPDGVLVLHTSPRALNEAQFPAAWDQNHRIYGRSALWYLQQAQSEDPR